MKKSLAIIFIFVLVILVGCEKEIIYGHECQECAEKEAEIEVNDISAVEPNNIKTADDIQPEEDPKSEPKSEEVEPKETIYSMNQDIKVDYLTYKITKAESFTKMGTSMLKKETNGKFIKVYLSITNNAKETKEIFTLRFRLIDSEDRKFDRLSDDMMYISDYLEFGKQLQPSLIASGAIVFEVPKDSTDIRLEISGDWLSTTAVLVSLSKIQDIGTDTTQQDEVDEMMDEATADAEEQMEELMNQCNSPFVCTSSCQEYMDVGQKDCPSGQVCCMQS